MDRIVMWLSAGLLSWLCYSTMTMREQMTRMDERAISSKEQQIAIVQEQSRLNLVDARLSLELKHLQILAAQHGWREQPEEARR
jgi:hypothetical protein